MSQKELAQPMRDEPAVLECAGGVEQPARLAFEDGLERVQRQRIQAHEGRRQEVPGIRAPR